MLRKRNNGNGVKTKKKGGFKNGILTCCGSRKKRNLKEKGS